MPMMMNDYKIHGIRKPVRNLLKKTMTLHTHKIPSHSSKKSRPLWPVMMDDNAPTQERRKLVKTYKDIDYSHGTSAHAHKALRIHLHKLWAYKLYLCLRGVEETNKLSKGFMGLYVQR